MKSLSNKEYADKTHNIKISTLDPSGREKSITFSVSMESSAGIVQDLQRQEKTEANKGSYVTSVIMRLQAIPKNLDLVEKLKNELLDLDAKDHRLICNISTSLAHLMEKIQRNPHLKDIPYYKKIDEIYNQIQLLLSKKITLTEYQQKIQEIKDKDKIEVQDNK